MSKGLQKSTLSALVFDVDGTLYSFFIMRLLSSVHAIRHPLFFSAFSWVRKELRLRRSSEPFRLQQTRLLAQRMNISQEKAENYIRFYVYREWAAFFPLFPRIRGLKTFLQRARTAGLKTGVLSDLPIDRRLEDLGVGEGWDAVLCSEDSGYLKPHPRPFHCIADTLNCPPSSILFIGDNPHYDITGAHSVGMKTAQIISFPRSPSKQADISFFNYHHLSNFLF